MQTYVNKRYALCIFKFISCPLHCCTTCTCTTSHQHDQTTTKRRKRRRANGTLFIVILHARLQKNLSALLHSAAAVCPVCPCESWCVPIRTYFPPFSSTCPSPPESWSRILASRHTTSTPPAPLAEQEQPFRLLLCAAVAVAVHCVATGHETPA